MIMMVGIFLLFGLIEQMSAIQCYTCNPEGGYYCSLPVTLDGGDESNENEIVTSSYNAGFACMSDQSMDASTRVEIAILRGIQNCQEVDVVNRRVHCCYTDNCNEKLPTMTRHTLTDLMSVEAGETSNAQYHMASILLVTINMIVQYIFFNK